MTLLVMAGGIFLAVMSTTVVSVALPTIGRDLQASATDLEWIVDAYVIVYASLLVVGGVLGDRHGRTGVFMLGVATFGLGALISALAPSVAVLLTGRVIQGLDPAMLIPGSLAILRATFEDSRLRAMAVGLWSTAGGLALALGPPVGGDPAGRTAPLPAIFAAGGGSRGKQHGLPGQPGESAAQRRMALLAPSSYHRSGTSSCPETGDVMPAIGSGSRVDSPGPAD